jgi:acylphosphatase
VGFRFFILERARALDLRGRVRNLADGSVEIEAEGDPKALDRLLEDAHRGPPTARVEHVTASRSEGPSMFDDFDAS